MAAELIAAALAAHAPDVELAEARALALRRLAALRRRGAPERVAARLRDQLLRRGYAAAVVLRVVRECVGVAVVE